MSAKSMRLETQVGIVGAGPAGLLLSHLLYRRHRFGRARVRCREYVEQRVRAGVLEQGTVDLLAERRRRALRREGLVHHGIELRFAGAATGSTFPTDRRASDHRVRPAGSGEGPDRGAPRGRRADPFEADDVGVHESSGRPRVRFRHGGEAGELACDFSPAATASTGSAAARYLPGALSVYEREYPFAWLGILAATPPPSRRADLRLARARLRALACARPRSPACICRSRRTRPANWPDARIWRELPAGWRDEASA